MGRREPPQFAALTGIRKGTLRNYIRGERVPDDAALILLKAATGVSIDWLLTGEGEMYAPAAPLDTEALTEIVEKVLKRRPDLPPREAADRIVEIYAALMEDRRKRQASEAAAAIETPDKEVS